MFIILVVLGVIAVVASSFLSNEILSSAFSWGGVLSMVIASMRYWNDAKNLLRVVILGAALAALIWLAIKKFGTNQ